MDLHLNRLSEHYLTKKLHYSLSLVILSHIMKIISSKVHGIIDYMTVIFLLCSPTLFKMEGTLCTFTYALAGIHFALTALTNFEPGLIKVIPFRIHGLIELIVSVALICLAYYFNSQDNQFGFYYYMLLAIAILLVFLLTDFRGERSWI